MGVEFDLKKTITNKLKRAFRTSIGGGLLVGGVGALIAGTVLSHDVAFDIAPQLKRADTPASAESLCAEMLKAQTAITSRLSSEAQPVVVMDMATCQRVYETPRP